MKYTIEGFSQAKIVELKLDNTDALILRWFVDFLPKMTTVTHEGKNYQWVKYQAVIDDLPCIRISNREVIARRFNKFVDAGIMEKYINKEGGVFTCFALTNKYLILVEDAFNYKVDPSTLKYIPLDPKVDTPLDAKVDTKDPSIIINSSIKFNKEKNIKKENLSIPDNFTEKEKEAIKFFIEHRKFIKSPLSNHAFNIFINKLNNFKAKNYDIIEIINNTIVSGWKTVYEPKPIKQSTKPTPKSIQEWLHNCNDNFVASEDF
jgi:hypothetical protein